MLNAKMSVLISVDLVYGAGAALCRIRQTFDEPLNYEMTVGH